MATRSLCSFLLWFCVVGALFVRASPTNKPFSCIGGAVYFSAHPVDGLLYQNPDLLHDLYVFKCVTTIVMTSGDRGMNVNFSQSPERGLQEAYVLMAGLPIDDSTREETTVRVGTHDMHSWSLRGIPNIQILYLRLPDGSPSGHDYDARGRESLSKLYHKDIDSITSTDGNVTYTLRDIKEIIAFILHTRKPNDIRILNHKAEISKDQEHQVPSDHTDHVVSAKLVQSIVAGEKIKATVKSYAGSVARKFEANIDSTHRDFASKAAAYFKYASYDEHMCQNVEECSDRSKSKSAEEFSNDDVRYVSQYLGREYIVL